VTITNTLAYCDTELITLVKCLVVQAPEAAITTLFTSQLKAPLHCSKIHVRLVALKNKKILSCGLVIYGKWTDFIES